MEEKTRTITTQGLYYGLLTGGGLVILSLILFIANLYMNRWFSSISYIILIAGIIMGTLDYRKKYLNGFITYGKAFSTCFMIGLFAGILASVYVFIFAKFIHPGFVQEILEQSREQMVAKNPNMTEEQIEMGLTWAAKFTSPVGLMISGFFMYAIISAVIGLVAAIFLKKEDPSLKTSM